MSVFLERALRQARKFFAYFSRCRGLAGRGLVTTSLFMLWNMPLPHWSKVSHRHFVISFLSTHRTAFIPSIRSSNSVTFLWESVRQRSEARVISRKPKNRCRISVNVKPSWRARWMIASR